MQKVYKKNKIQVNPRSHATKQSHKKTCMSISKKACLRKQLIKYWLSPPTLDKINSYDLIVMLNSKELCKSLILVKFKESTRGGSYTLIVHC